MTPAVRTWVDERSDGFPGLVAPRVAASTTWSLLSPATRPAGGQRRDAAGRP